MNITITIIFQVNSIGHRFALNTLHIIAFGFGAKLCHTIIAIAGCGLRVSMAMSIFGIVTAASIRNGLIGTRLHTTVLIICNILQVTVYVLSACHIVTVNSIHGIQHDLVIIGLAVHDIIRGFRYKLHFDGISGFEGDIRKIHEQFATHKGQSVAVIQINPRPTIDCILIVPQRGRFCIRCLWYIAQCGPEQVSQSKALQVFICIRSVGHCDLPQLRIGSFGLRVHDAIRSQRLLFQLRCDLLNGLLQSHCCGIRCRGRRLSINQKRLGCSDLRCILIGENQFGFLHCKVILQHGCDLRCLFIAQLCLVGDSRIAICRCVNNLQKVRLRTMLTWHSKGEVYSFPDLLVSYCTIPILSNLDNIR